MDPEKTNHKTHKPKPIKIKTVLPVIENEVAGSRYNNYQHCCEYIKNHNGIVKI